MQHDTIKRWFTYWLHLVWTFSYRASNETPCSLLLRTLFMCAGSVSLGLSVPLSSLKAFINNTRMRRTFIKLYYFLLCALFLWIIRPYNKHSCVNYDAYKSAEVSCFISLWFMTGACLIMCLSKHCSCVFISRLDASYGYLWFVPSHRLRQ